MRSFSQGHCWSGKIVHQGRQTRQPSEKDSLTKNAQIAQSVEQRIENPRVGGSIPPLGTII